LLGSLYGYQSRKRRSESRETQTKEKKASGEEGNEKEAVMEIFESLLQLNENRHLAEEEKD